MQGIHILCLVQEAVLVIKKIRKIVNWISVILIYNLTYLIFNGHRNRSISLYLQMY
jgi:hypothetical protein